MAVRALLIHRSAVRTGCIGECLLSDWLHKPRGGLPYSRWYLHCICTDFIVSTGKIHYVWKSPTIHNMYKCNDIVPILNSDTLGYWPAHCLLVRSAQTTWLVAGTPTHKLYRPLCKLQEVNKGGSSTGHEYCCTHSSVGLGVCTSSNQA